MTLLCRGPNRRNRPLCSEDEPKASSWTIRGEKIVGDASPGEFLDADDSACDRSRIDVEVAFDSSNPVAAIVTFVQQHLRERARGATHENGARSRDIFPLPYVPEASARQGAAALPEVSRSSFVSGCTAVVLGLNLLAGTAPPTEACVTNSAQRAVHCRVVAHVQRWLKRAGEVTVPEPSTCLATLVDDSTALGKARAPPLVAAECDLLERSGLVDPLPDLPASVQGTLSSAKQLFGDVSSKLGDIPRIRKRRSG